MTDRERSKIDDRIAGRVAPDRRELLKLILGGAGFAVPLMASFSLEGLQFEASVAQSNMPMDGNMGPTPS